MDKFSKDVLTGLLIVAIIVGLYFLLAKKPKPSQKKVEKEEEQKEEVKEEVKEEPSIPEPMQEPFCEAYGSTEFTSDVRDVNNKNYESYVFGGKIEK